MTQITDVTAYMTELGQRARTASRALAAADTHADRSDQGGRGGL